MIYERALRFVILFLRTAKRGPRIPERPPGILRLFTGITIVRSLWFALVIYEFMRVYGMVIRLGRHRLMTRLTQLS